MVYKSADHGKIWSILFFFFFFTIIRKKISEIGFIFRCEIIKTKRMGALCSKSRRFHGVFTIYQKNPEISVGMLMERLFWFV